MTFHEGASFLPLNPERKATSSGNSQRYTLDENNRPMALNVIISHGITTRKNLSTTVAKAGFGQASHGTAKRCQLQNWKHHP